jgi:peptidoglycan hydrolase-like protein with peptidoglycan-binding domain
MSNGSSNKKKRDRQGANGSFPTEPGAARGDRGEQVEKLQAYLRRFGYLRPTDEEAGGFAAMEAGSRAPVATVGVFDDSTAAGLRRFQAFVGLPVTGELDEATIAQMSRLRCGFPDLPLPGGNGNGAGDGAGLASFVAQGSRWNRTNLTYGYQEFSGDLTQAQIRTALASAFTLWSQATPLRFTEIPVANGPDIVVRFVAGDHGDGNTFDGAGSVLAHAYYPPPGGGAFAGDAHFDDAETWTVALPVPAGGTDLVTVAAHEIGHSLGLAHSTDAGALMYPYYGGPHRHLGADDVLGIQTIYGTRVRAVPRLVRGRGPGGGGGPGRPERQRPPRPARLPPRQSRR